MKTFYKVASVVLFINTVIAAVFFFCSLSTGDAIPKDHLLERIANKTDSIGFALVGITMLLGSMVADLHLQILTLSPEQKDKKRSWPFKPEGR
ncbi:MAG: hypothetical protein NT003_02780 [Candidatus Magasanikbacteria bacterium]|nr:hypothetical protein [Candidatus Magasanikbacteria bacterium]